MLKSIKNAFVKRFLKHLLDGNKGTNALAAVLTPILATQVDYVLALQGLKFQSVQAELELLKVLLIGLTGLVLWLIGKYPKVARWLHVVETAVVAAEQSVEQTQQDPALK